MTTTAVIIGGDAAGMSAASKIKRELQDAEVIVFEKTQTISYSACGMPYWIGGTIQEEDDLLVMTPETAREKRGIDVRLGHEAIAIDPSAKRVTVTDLADGATLEQPYDLLVIATGARGAAADSRHGPARCLHPARFWRQPKHLPLPGGIRSRTRRRDRRRLYRR